MNKKVFALCLALTFSISASSGSRALDRFSISDPGFQDIEHWANTYEAYGYVVNVDVDIETPDVDTLPVLLLAQAHGFSQDRVNEYYTDDEIKNKLTSFLLTENGYLSICYNLHTYDKTSKEIGRTSFSVEQQSYDSVKNNRYFQNPFTVAEAVSFIEEITNQLNDHSVKFAPVDKVYIHSPLRYYDEKSSEYGEFVRELGAYEFELRPIFYGIPVDMGVCVAYQAEGKYKNDIILRSQFGAVGYVISKDEYGLNTLLLNEEKVLYEDMPVCPISKIIETCEKAIQSGNIREIFQISLGYVLYYPPEGENNYQYWAVPSWVVRCRYVESPKSEEYGLDKQGPYNRLSSYVPLVINAQTGEIVDPGNTDSDRCYAPKILKR